MYFNIFLSFALFLYCVIAVPTYLNNEVIRNIRSPKLHHLFGQHHQQGPVYDGPHGGNYGLHGGGGSFAGSAAISGSGGSHGGSSQSQSASFALGPFTASFSQSQSGARHYDAPFSDY